MMTALTILEMGIRSSLTDYQVQVGSSYSSVAH
jgi:hypothetical protein